MANENMEGFEQRKDFGLLSPGMLVVVVVLFLTLTAWGGLFYYQKDLDLKIQDLKKNNDEYVKNSVMDKEAQKVADFQIRLSQTEDLLTQGRNLFANFNGIENSILPSVYLNSYEFDDKEGTLKLACSTDNFNSVALQTLGFKKSDVFSDVRMDDAYVDEEGNRIRFKLTLKLK